MGEAVVRAIPAKDLRLAWGEVSRFVDYALRYSQGEFESLDIFARAISGKMQVWPIYLASGLVAVATTEIVDYPHVSALRVVTLSGDQMEKWKSELDTALTAFAVEHHLDRIELMGRGGFEKTLAELGFERAYVCLTKGVNGNGKRHRNNSRGK